MVTGILASPWTTWGIAAAATAGVIIRPFSWPEYVWAATGAVLLVVLGLLPVADALSGVAKGTDVYLFLIGMMLLAELARQEGLFDWLAAKAAARAGGSATRLFTLVFCVGTVVTVFLSNDATAVVLTPAVAAVVKAAKADRPLPYLFICAFIANAASFVLPISNPANLVIYGSHMPPLLHWLPQYALPSVLSILATYFVLCWSQRNGLQQTITSDIDVPDLTTGGKAAAFGIGMTAAVLLVSSGFDIQLGLRLSWPVWRPHSLYWCARNPVRWRWRRTSPGACCRSWPGCSYWSNPWRRPASPTGSGICFTISCSIRRSRQPGYPARSSRSLATS